MLVAIQLVATQLCAPKVAAMTPIAGPAWVRFVGVVGGHPATIALSRVRAP